jgi:hypothetical protein
MASSASTQSLTCWRIDERADNSSCAHGVRPKRRIAVCVRKRQLDSSESYARRTRSMASEREELCKHAAPACRARAMRRTSCGSSVKRKPRFAANLGMRLCSTVSGGELRKNFPGKTQDGDGQDASCALETMLSSFLRCSAEPMDLRGSRTAAASQRSIDGILTDLYRHSVNVDNIGVTVDQGPMLGLLIGALPPALTRLLGATSAGRTARELNDCAFLMYCMCMADPRRRFRRLPVDDDDVLANPPGG